MTSAELQKAIRKGARVLYRGKPVDFRPRAQGDQLAWRVRGFGATERVRANDCRVIWPRKEGGLSGSPRRTATGAA